ncbi:HNH endonuclease (plasmid) [Chryseobacterium arthrosphaerae]|uniref:HNH endonuclease n=1 Tax=Chryseobacterium arthrosphaerae TaxID=651561 RepID=A0A3S0QV21_9FLAO|nr:HNH endonuclease [Chryseobacterium arthrosphaerae]
MVIIDKLGEESSFSFEKLRKLLLEYGKPSTDEYFREKLNGNLYEENIGATRYILSSIELSENNSREKYVNFYDRNKNQFVWTIEHILPQGENIPLHWVDMIADGNTELAEKIRKEFVHKLGNLTLTGYNSQLSNMQLDKKQDKKDKDGHYIGFKNGLSLNETISNIPIWNRDK